jgi:hypothetical protein
MASVVCENYGVTVHFNTRCWWFILNAIWENDIEGEFYGSL